MREKLKYITPEIEAIPLEACLLDASPVNGTGENQGWDDDDTPIMPPIDDAKEANPFEFEYELDLDL